MLRRLTVRVYGLLVNDREEVLITDEVIKGNKITKFPGGGLILGEGTIDCLVREFKEECGKDIVVTDHFYTTDFFQNSYFDDESQVISIYYRVDCPEWSTIETIQTPFDFPVLINVDSERMRWCKLNELPNQEFLTLPIDKKVAEMIMIKGKKIGYKIGD